MGEETKPIAMGDGKSERLRSTCEAGEPTQGTPRREGGRRATEPLRGKASGHGGPADVSTKLERIATRARERPQEVITTLNHHINIDWVTEAYRRTKKGGAAGVDGTTARKYETNLAENLASLLERFKSGSYYAPPVKRVHIPKGDGSKTRPIGIPTFEDKVLQRSVAMVLEAIYEQEFYDCSFGFRPGKSAHEALETLWQGLMKMNGGVVLEVDIQGFFDSLEHGHLRSFLDLRVRDGVIRRTVDKWLKAGVLEEGRLVRSREGTPQGGVISPLLANIYLHHVLDMWFHEEIKPRLSGEVFLIRYADDFVIVFENEVDARRVQSVLAKRFGRFGLTLHPEKTRLVHFGRPRSLPRGKDRDDHGDRPGSFDLLGFTHYWGTSRKGRWVVKRKTAKTRMRRALKAISTFCRKARHWTIREQHKALSAKTRGHYGYYGITGNGRALAVFREHVRRSWCWWLNRRSQKPAMSWTRFHLLERCYPLPQPVVVQSVFRSAAKP